MLLSFTWLLIDPLRADLKSDIASLKTDVNSALAAQKADMNSALAAQKADIAGLNSKFDQLEDHIIDLLSKKNP